MFAALLTPPETRTLALERLTPEFLKDATRFQTDAHIFNGRWVIETLRRYEGEPHRLLDPLYTAVEMTKPGSGFGRKRTGGRFELAYFAFVFSRIPDVRPWWQQAGHSIWTASGFKERPSYPLVHRRFAELEHEHVIDAMEEVARTLIQLAVKGSDGRVGRFLHFDSTEAETHARLEHVCPSWSPCWMVKTPGSWKGGGRVSAAATTPVVRAERHLQSAEPEPEEIREDTDIGDAEEIKREPGRLRVRMLLPLWRDTPTYLALRNSHDRYERVHHHWRVRWRSGSDDHSLRPKRRGRHNQQLRANAALLIEWLMINWRENWLPDSRPFGKPDQDRIISEDAEERAEQMTELRADLGLDQPYGSKAVALKIGPARPLVTSTKAEDPSEPDEPIFIDGELPGADIEERLPGDAAEVPLDDLPF